MAVTDFPDLNKTFESLQKEREEILAKSAPLRKDRDAIMTKIQPFEDQARAIALKIKEIESPRLAEIDNQISAIARATGGTFLSDGASSQPDKVTD